MNDILFQILGEERAQEAIELLSGAFTESEPITRALGISRSDFARYVEIYTLDSLQYRLSSAAIDPETGKLIGVTINRDYFAPKPDRVSEIPEVFLPMSGLMNDLGQNYFKNVPPRTGIYFYLFIGGVLGRYSGKGVNFRKALFNEQLASESGFKFLVVEPTGPETQHIYLNKLGYDEVSSIDYQTYLWRGDRVFSGIESPQSCKLAIRKVTRST